MCSAAMIFCKLSQQAVMTVFLPREQSSDDVTVKLSSSFFCHWQKCNVFRCYKRSFLVCRYSLINWKYPASKGTPIAFLAMSRKRCGTEQHFGVIRTTGVPRNFVRGGGDQQIQLRTEDRENGDLEAVAPYSGVLEAAVIWYKKFHFI
jgi:hypothetical protein